MLSLVLTWYAGLTGASSSHLIYPLTARVVGAPQFCNQFPPFSPVLHFPPGTWRTPGLSIPWCCLPTSPSLCLVFFPLLLCLARWFWPDLMNGRHDHTTEVIRLCLKPLSIFKWQRYDIFYSQYFLELLHLLAWVLTLRQNIDVINTAQKAAYPNTAEISHL